MNPEESLHLGNANETLAKVTNSGNYAEHATHVNAETIGPSENHLDELLHRINHIHRRFP